MVLTYAAAALTNILIFSNESSKSHTVLLCTGCKNSDGSTCKVFPKQSVAQTGLNDMPWIVLHLNDMPSKNMSKLWAPLGNGIFKLTGASKLATTGLFI